MTNLTLLTDLYQLTMLAGYHGCNKTEQVSCFDLYFRRLPFGGGYCLAGGLEPALEYLRNLKFGADEIAYLKSLSIFQPSFLEWLADFQFQGDIWAVKEGTLVFPGEPLLRIEAPLPQAQLVESALLNIINFNTLVASKAARVVSAARGGTVLEFGLRRAQGIDGALAASRAAYLGGCHATSNTLAGKLFGIPVKGTHAHSWIMSFPSELEAFQAYADNFPTACTLLVDTYDTLSSGVPNAIKIGKHLQSQGFDLAGIRLDSGDLCHLSIEARKMLDDAGLTKARIVASNDLDEHEIQRLLNAGAKIDIWGVGTNLVTCKDEPALGGVYKLAAAGDSSTNLEPRIKISSNPIKTTVPGVKQVYRIQDSDGIPVGDLLCLDTEEKPAPGSTFVAHAIRGGNEHSLNCVEAIPLLEKVVSNGTRVGEAEPLARSRERALESLDRLPERFKSLTEPAEYPVGMSQALHAIRQSML